MRQVTHVLNRGEVIAYPTETVYGLGCDPFNALAVIKLLSIKNRPLQKGLILIASDFRQLIPYIYQLNSKRMIEIRSTWPGPYTWLFPATSATPPWITGQHDTVAVRVTAHPIATALCHAFAKPIVSTSANFTNMVPAKTALRTRLAFGNAIDLIIHGTAGPHSKPSEIRDAVTGRIVRSM